MSKVIEFQKYQKRKKLQNLLRFCMIISMVIVMGILVYTLTIMKRDHPVRVPPYVEFKAG